MDDFKLKLIHLHHCRGISWTHIYRLLKTDPDLKSIYDLAWHSNKYLHLPTPDFNQALTDLHSNAILEQIHRYRENNIHAITLFDTEYPLLLKEIYQPPWILYIKGNPALLNAKKLLAVVGSREITEYGRKAIHSLFPPLINKGITIVSGLAKGVDTLAHSAAMKNGGSTIGVIAGGVYHIYPKENQPLALEMMKSQLIVSEHPPNTKPARWHFPHRNRIISGLSHGTLIVEAKRKSGSLITANFAVNEGREVFAVPGSILSPNSAGTNDLIQQGAKLVKTADDILEEFKS
ncbi:DNA-protecting protein DprA [Bacillus canaveralius]|uniref:DNA-protecting protein DprA n=1 Tax=Bacillus canaveralius TaxID=1403243 RepID=A0A2N5GP23_9BACI|nr:DNA-processing protein DprA [Bacillus canaveralius]PLR84199.1 DNA-protecting protein DprA [Bacillus canaveralius]PLR96155.1 DNA-protecting protein DprA [Bacillus canaveralius]